MPDELDAPLTLEEWKNTLEKMTGRSLEELAKLEKHDTGNG